MTPYTSDHTRRHILLCVAGLTPQIIPETLYALTQQRGERVDEIRVITTLGGRDRIRQALLDPQHGKFFAFCRDYHLDKRISTADAQIHLADIPFIRLQGVRSEWLPGSGHSYSDFVEQAQDDLDLLDSSHELRINARTKTIVVANRAIKLTERELLIYALLAYLRQEGRGEDGFVRLDQVSRSDLDTVFRRITAAKGQAYGLQDHEYVPRFAFIAPLAQQLESTRAQDRADVTRTFQETISRMKRKCEVQRLPERYLITIRGERGALQYGLLIAPERITWDHHTVPSGSP